MEDEAVEGCTDTVSCAVIDGLKKPGYHVTNSVPVGEMPSDDGAITKIDEGDGRLFYTLILEETGKVPQYAENSWWHWFLAH